MVIEQKEKKKQLLYKLLKFSSHQWYKCWAADQWVLGLIFRGVDCFRTLARSRRSEVCVLSSIPELPSWTEVVSHIYVILYIKKTHHS